MRTLCLALLLAGCHRTTPIPTPQTTPSGTVATVAVSPYDIISPFLCRITATTLDCVTTMDVRFRRGQVEAQFPRGHQFSFNTPKGSGTGLVFFGCAGTNECGPGYFIFTSKPVSVVPVDPARYWSGGTLDVPYGSHGIIEVDVDNGAFTQIRNRWAAAEAAPQLKAGTGIVITCTNQACTIGLQ